MRLSGLAGSPFALFENVVGGLIFGLETASSSGDNEAEIPSRDATAGSDAGEEIGDSAKKKRAKKME